MEISIASFAQSPASWSFFDQYLELRRRKFCSELGWSIWSDDRVELDQYDNPNTFYSYVHEKGVLVAAARLIPADLEWHGWRNLLVDAHKGMVPAIPPGFLPPDFDFTSSFECSRLVVDEDNLPSTSKAHLSALNLLVQGLIHAASLQNGRKMLSLSPPPLKRGLRMAGFDVAFEGAPYTCPDDQRSYRVLSMPVPRMPDEMREIPHFSRQAARVA
ncbi:hypothetical protein GFB49_11520 [Epibacterium sp. SM1979]|uniref:Acyl-homoserine-lactone synthase n=1 Tax=Tritonibacter litoralis TaxID=2662264 RepID=A0A843YHD8_9RHOB|nr:acyl-homoserine-lactone synthase [Tritonibacter litoralis]MQQ09085.1 hypothetical protein [Tritonibacter litoralis]